MTPTPGNPDFRFETPAVSTIIYELRRVVLARGSDYSKAQTDDRLLPPFEIIPYVHRRSAGQVYGKAKRRIEQARTVGLCLSIHNGSANIPHTIGPGCCETGRPAQEGERGEKAKDPHADSCRGASNGYG